MPAVAVMGAVCEVDCGRSESALSRAGDSEVPLPPGDEGQKLFETSGRKKIFWQ
jgi:hypothetical protein